MSGKAFNSLMSFLIKKWLPIYLLLIIIFDIAVCIFISLSGLSSLVGVFISLIADIIVIIFMWSLVKSDIKRWVKRNNGFFSVSLIKAVLTRLILISTILAGVSIGIGYITSMLIGGDQYWMQQASLVQDLLARQELIDSEDNKYDWGIDFGISGDNSDIIKPNPGGVVKDDYAQILGESEADKILAIARREADYYKANNIKGGHKYWDWFRNAPGGYSVGSGWHWCANFVTYCVYEAGLATFNMPEASNYTFGCLMRQNSGPLNCGSWYYWMLNMGWEMHEVKDGYIPRPGDIALFHYNNQVRNGKFNHIGIVDRVEDGKIYYIEGNVRGTGTNSYNRSKVDYIEYKLNKDGRKGGYTVYFTPNYKVTKTDISGGTYTGDFDISKYPKDANGYYQKEQMLQIAYDFAILEMGLNSAAAVGIATNIYHESGSGYDQLEVATGGKAYVSKDLSSICHPVASKYGNGNYKGVPGIENLMATWSDDLYYKSSSGNWIRYGMGYGLVQWSFGRRVALFNFAKDNGFGTALGPNGLLAQLYFIKYELENNSAYKSTWETLKSVPNDFNGAYKATQIMCHNYERPYGHKSNLSSCGPCNSRPEFAVSTIWPKFGNTAPSIS